MNLKYTDFVNVKIERVRRGEGGGDGLYGGNQKAERAFRKESTATAKEEEERGEEEEEV